MAFFGCGGERAARLIPPKCDRWESSVIATPGSALTWPALPGVGIHAAVASRHMAGVDAVHQVSGAQAPFRGFSSGSLARVRRERLLRKAEEQRELERLDEELRQRCNEGLRQRGARGAALPA